MNKVILVTVSALVVIGLFSLSVAGGRRGPVRSGVRHKRSADNATTVSAAPGPDTNETVVVDQVAGNDTLKQDDYAEFAGDDDYQPEEQVVVQKREADADEAINSEEADAGNREKREADDETDTEDVDQENREKRDTVVHDSEEVVE